mgnify:FL=1
MRVGSYLQAVSYFVLVLVAPDEGGVRPLSLSPASLRELALTLVLSPQAESVWLGLSISFSFLFALIMQLIYVRLARFSCATGMNAL